MKHARQWGTVLLAALLALGLTACSAPRTGYADYDVSAYVKALLDSSYHDSHRELTRITGISEGEARENCDTTVDNAAVIFCNTYGVYPDEDQLEELQDVMRQAYALTRYTVKDERKVDTGYYLEVEIASITNFEGLAQELDRLRQEASAEAEAANNPQPEPADDDAEPAEEEDAGEEPAPAPTPVPADRRVDPERLFVEKVLDFCRKELANISYDPETRSVPLHILQTDQGELQMDMNEIGTIDQTVVRFG